MKSIAAVVPAIPSWFSVPVSHTYGGSGSWVVRRTGSSTLGGLAARVHEPDVRAEELVGRAEQEVAADRP